MLLTSSTLAPCGEPFRAVDAGPRAARASSASERLRIAFGIAGAAVALGAIEVGGTVALLGGFTGGGDPINAFLFGLLVLPVFGIVIFGLPALVAIVPIAADLVRARGRDRAPPRRERVMIGVWPFCTAGLTPRTTRRVRTRMPCERSLPICGSGPAR